MKTAILLCSTLACVSSFVVPPPAQVRFSTFLREEASDATASTFKGAESIAAITKDVKTIFTSEDISKILPHRYPFLLVDKVVEYEAGKVKT